MAAPVKSQYRPHQGNRLGEAVSHAVDGVVRGLNSGKTKTFRDIVVPAGGRYIVIHNFGRLPDGWIVTGVRTVGINFIYQNDMNGRELTLKNDGGSDVTLSIMVF